MSEPMSESEVVRRLATREWDNAWVADGCRLKDALNYLGSLDALQPVLATLTDEEWFRLNDRLYELSGCDGLQQRKMARFCLMIPPHTLAHAIADVLTDALDKAGAARAYSAPTMTHISRKTR